ncbi:MAG: PilW family protein [bacterium]
MKRTMFLNNIKNNIKKNKDGFTLIELVMTIILTGILSVGLYEVVMFGIKDYITNENVLHQSNSMTYAMSVIRRNLVNAAMPPASPPSFNALGGVCPFNPMHEPSQTNPICVFSGFNPGVSCDSNGIGNEIAFLQNSNNYKLIIYCVVNNILYEEEAVTNGTPTSYPVADNINRIIF